MAFKKISGPALCGFADFFYDTGSHVVGATSAKNPTGKPAFVPGRTATGRKYTALVLNAPQPGATHQAPSHKRSIANARLAGKRAVSSGKALQKALAKPTTKIKVPALPTGVHGGARHPAQVRHAHFTLAQLHKIADAAVKVGSGAIKSADKHEQFVKALTAKQKAGVSALQRKLAPGSTSIHGVLPGDHQARRYSDYCAMLGVDAQGLSPGMPGYDPTTEDGTGAGGSAATSAMSTLATPDGGGAGGALDPSLDPSQNYGLGAPPTSPPPLQAGLDYSPDPHPDGKDQTVYDSSSAGGDITKLVNGAVVYDGTTHMPDHMDIGSYVAFFGPLDGSSSEDGEGIHPDNGTDSPWTGGYRIHNDGWWFNWNGDNKHGTESGDLKKMGMGPHHWGPLIGNPAHPLRGLRLDIGSGKYFWFRDTAPDWATAQDDQARLNQAILDYKAKYAAAASNAVAVAAQDQLDAANAAALVKQQAADDAQHVADMNKQARADELAAAQQNTQQAAFDQQQAQQQVQLDAQQAAQDVKDAAAQADLDRQQQAADIKAQAAQDAVDARMQQAEAAYAQQHPEQYFAQGGNGGGGNGGDGADTTTDDGGGGEDASQTEADQIDQVEALGAGGDAFVLLMRKQQLGSEGAIGGDGEVIGLDDWGNALE